MTEANGNKTRLRGILYVLGGACTFAAGNIMLPHDWRSWAAFGCGIIANTCILWRAYIDKSHARYSSDKLITDPLEPAEPTEPTP